jgi:hypothetical protein
MLLLILKFTFISQTRLVNVKAKLFLCLINYTQCREGVWESGGTDQTFLTSVIDVREWSASRLGPFTPTKRVPGTQWIGGKICSDKHTPS